MGTSEPSSLKDKKNHSKQLIAQQVMFLGATASMIMSTNYTHNIISKNLNRIGGKSFW